MSVYVDIANTIAHKITNGFYLPGDKIYSRNEICDEFRVSPMTAARVQDELLQKGLVKKIKGRGVFVSVPDSLVDNIIAAEKTRQIVFFNINTGENRDSFCYKIFSGIESQAAANGINLRCEFINTGKVAQTFLELPLNPNSNEGYVVISSSEASHLACGALLMRGNVRTVLIDSVIPGSACVISDNLGGMEQLVGYLYRQGCRKIVFAKNYSNQSNFNSYERTSGYELATRKHGIEPYFVSSGDYNELLALASATKPPDAIMFPQDDPALRLIEMMDASGIQAQPMVTGFDSFSSKPPELRQRIASLEVDREGLGRAAVELLSRDKYSDEIVRIKGKLVPAESHNAKSIIRGKKVKT